MAQQEMSRPVDDNSVPKVDNAISVGEDLKFQERWWHFEHVIWSIFLLILIADVLGVFGRGWLSKAELHTPGSAMDVKYERVERASTPSVLTISFQPDAIENGAVHLFVSNSIVKELGNQRVSPQPEHSLLGSNGITYTFPVQDTPAIVNFSLGPSSPGSHHFVLQVLGKAAATGRVIVVP